MITFALTEGCVRVEELAPVPVFLVTMVAELFLVVSPYRAASLIVRAILMECASYHVM